MLLVLALLGCTAAAFAVTEGLKLEKSPITDTEVGKVVAPDSVTYFAKASISFVLRKPDRLTVQAIVQIARGLDKPTIAEFVESEPILRELVLLGVDFAQGYHVGRPFDVALLVGAASQAEPADASRR